MTPHLLAVHIQAHRLPVVRAGHVLEDVRLQNVVHTYAAQTAANHHVKVELPRPPAAIIAQNSLFFVAPQRYKSHHAAGQRIQLYPGRHGQLLQAARLRVVDRHIVILAIKLGCLVDAPGDAGGRTRVARTDPVALCGLILKGGRAGGVVQSQVQDLRAGLVELPDLVFG